MNKISELIIKAGNGDHRAISKIISSIEYPSVRAVKILSKIMSQGGRAHVIGITGFPGSGKSTLISRMINVYRSRGEKVGVVAVDPSSPYTRGALMGDRIRMQSHATDPGVFIRSIPTRGHRGGVSAAALLTIEVYDGLGFDRILLETVGVGQIEVDVMNAAHTVTVLTMPGAGDEIQALKAGIMEIGDIYVVNKADKPEAEETYKQLKFSIEIGEFSAKGGWKPRVLKTSAIRGIGITDLIGIIDEHLSFIKKGGTFDDRVKIRRAYMLKTILLWMIENRFENLIKTDEEIKHILKMVESGSMAPYEAAYEVLKKVLP